MSVSIRFDRFRTALPSLNAKELKARHPSRSVSIRLRVER